MLHLVLGLALTAEPVVPQMATPQVVAETSPAPKWPAALFFIGGGITFWTGAGLLISNSISNKCGGCPQPDRSGPLAAGAALASIGFASMLVGIVWLIWTRSQPEAAMNQPAEMGAP